MPSHGCISSRIGSVSEIKALRAAGADFIVAYPHWDKEHKSAANSRTREAAKLLLESGVDVILGSHPHVVQDIEYMTVERDGKSIYGTCRVFDGQLHLQYVL